MTCFASADSTSASKAYLLVSVHAAPSGWGRADSSISASHIEPGDAGRQPVSLFRAISEAEADDIRVFRGFRPTPTGSSYEGKPFATSVEDACRFGRLLFRLDGKPFFIVQATIQRSSAARLDHVPADGMEAIVVSRDQLAGFNAEAAISLLDALPLV